MILLGKQRWAVALALVTFMATLVGPAPARAENIARTMGGAAGLAAGAMGGAALASAVIAASGLAAMGPLATLMAGTAIVGASGWVGSKIFSKLGLTLDQTMGPKAVWAMLGASIGAVVAMALIPAVGPFVGPVGLIAKALIGGVVVGGLAALFSKQLEAVATPRTIYAAAGGAIGAMAGGIPGAVAGVAGGYAVGAVMDDNFYADEQYTLRDQYKQGGRWVRRVHDRAVDYVEDVNDWVNDRQDRFQERCDGQRDYYDQCEESFYWEGEYGQDRSYVADQRPSHKGTIHQQTGGRSDDELFQLKSHWQEELARYEELHLSPSTVRQQMDAQLKRVQAAERAYQKALRGCQGY